MAIQKVSVRLCSPDMLVIEKPADLTPEFRALLNVETCQWLWPQIKRHVEQVVEKKAGVDREVRIKCLEEELAVLKSGG